MVRPLLLRLFLGVAALCIGSANARTIYVSPSSQTKIQNAIDSASSGDIVHLNDGKFYISQPLTFKSNVELRGSGSSNTAKLSAYSHGHDVQFTLTNLDNVVFRNIDFVGINLQFEGNGAHTKGLNYEVHGCNFKNSKNDKFIQFKYCKGGTVKDSTFYRGSSFFGRGIGMYMSHDTVITGNTIEGHLDTGININGNLNTLAEVSDNNKRTLNTVVTHNTITRTGGSEQDHGIYVIGFKSLLIENNEVSGWTPTGDGGCIKARNGEGLTVLYNTFHDSGILLYTYDSTYPHYLKDVKIKHNTMYISGTNKEAKARGVSYWSTVSNGVESNWRIASNVINNGCIDLNSDTIDVPAVNGYVRNNDCPIIKLKAGIKTW